MGTGITWYDVVGALPGAAAAEIRRSYDSKASLLRPELLAGAPSPVVSAASRAQGILDAAWHVLGDPDRRGAYDESAGIRSRGGGLVRRESIPADAGWRSSDFDFVAGNAGAELLGALMVLAEFMGPRPHEPKRITVPDVRGLFFSACSTVMGRQGVRVTAVRLTAHPMAVDGLVVSQSPAAMTKMRKGRELTVQVWHPSARR
jgi:curved DNA-binding protein CbpA